MDDLKRLIRSNDAEQWDPIEVRTLFTHCPIDPKCEKDLEEVYKIRREDETVILKRHGVDLYPSTLRSLKIGKCVKGDIIEACMRSWKKDAKVQVVCFDTFFVTVLTKEGEEMAKQKYQQELSDMDNKVLLIPSHIYGCHWALYAVYLEHGVVHDYDSLDYGIKENKEKFGKQRAQHVRKLCSFFEEYKKPQDKWKLAQIPRYQKNSVDCGIFLLVNLFSLMFDMAIKDGGIFSVTNTRRALSYGIWDNGSGYKAVSPDEEIPIEGNEGECVIAAIVRRHSSSRNNQLVRSPGDDMILGVANDDMDRLINTLLTLPEPEQVSSENSFRTDHERQIVYMENSPSALLPGQDMDPPTQPTVEPTGPECVNLTVPFGTIDLLSLQLDSLRKTDECMIDILQDSTSVVDKTTSVLTSPDGPAVLVDTRMDVDIGITMEDSNLIDANPVSEERNARAVELKSPKISKTDLQVLNRYKISYQELVTLRRGNTAFVDFDELGKEYTRNASSAWEFLTMREVLKALGDNPWEKIAREITKGSRIFHKWQESYQSASTPFSFRYQRKWWHSRITSMLQAEYAELEHGTLFKCEKRNRKSRDRKSKKQRALYQKAMIY